MKATGNYEAVKDVDPAIFEHEHQLAVAFSLDRHLSIGRLGHDYMHQESP